ncbi:hypothetical protein EON65_18510 [archaeon]|nr:MAG: hypothetical protein EON65_18510 [archaeon]
MRLQDKVWRAPEGEQDERQRKAAWLGLPGIAKSSASQLVLMEALGRKVMALIRNLLSCVS